MRDELNRLLAGQYAVEHELGRGGMATVWLARDLRHGRQVALKVLHPELAGAIGVDRFIREVRLTSRLQHPGIVPVFDSGILAMDDGGRLPWYAMPYVEGESLRSRLAREQHLPIDAAIRITEEVAAALQAAHQLGIVHRDIKPENVLLADGVTYVVDFGIAKALADTGDERLTSTGFVIGTPAYMSPEQATAGVMDSRSDQYSLGSLLYEMLAGEPPFTGPSAASIIARRLAEPARPIRAVRPTVPPGVEQAVLTSLERIPADRFDSVAAFVAALRAAGPAGRILPSRRRAGLFPGAVAVLVVLLGGWLLWRPDQDAAAKPRDPEVVALYQRGAQGYDKRTPAGTREAIAAFSAALERDSTYAAAWNGLARTYVFAFRRRFTVPGVDGDSMLKLAVSAVDRAVMTEPASTDAWLTRAQVNRAIDPTDMRVPIQSSRRAIALDSNNAQAWYTLATSLADAGEIDSAMEGWRQNVRRNPTYTQGVAFLALGHYWRRQFDSAAFWADSVVTLDPNYLLGRTTVGYVAAERGDYARGIAAFEAARRLSTDVELVNALAGRSLVEARQGTRDRAMATLREIDSIGRDYARTNAHTAVYVAQTYAVLGHTERALRILESYSPIADLHLQLHLQCDPPLDPIALNRRFQALLVRPRPPDKLGC